MYRMLCKEHFQKEGPLAFVRRKVGLLRGRSQQGCDTLVQFLHVSSFQIDDIVLTAAAFGSGGVLSCHQVLVGGTSLQAWQLVEDGPVTVVQQ